MENKRSKGGHYEQLAAKYLSDRGYRIISHNYRCHAGEIDLIAQEGGYLVFIEVKYRADARWGMPQEAVSAVKQRTIARVAGHYMMNHHIPENTPVRFDVVAILGDQCQIIQNAFEGNF